MLQEIFGKMFYKIARKDRHIWDISEEQWLEHFKKVFDVDNVDVEEDADVTLEQNIDVDDINDDIFNKNMIITRRSYWSYP